MARYTDSQKAALTSEALTLVNNGASMASAARAVAVPVSTLKDWIYAARPATEQPAAPAPVADVAPVSVPEGWDVVEPGPDQLAMAAALATPSAPPVTDVAPPAPDDRKVTASAKLRGHDLTDLPVLNPGDWFGKTWVIEIGGSYVPFFLVVEADTMQDAIDVLCDDDTYGHQIHIPESDLKDYGFPVSPGDVIGGVEITEKAWMRLDGVLITDAQEGSALMEPYSGGNAGTPCNLDYLWVHGTDGKGYPVTYHVEGLDQPIQPDGLGMLDSLLSESTGLDWDSILADLESEDWTSDDSFMADENTEVRSTYIGTVFQLMPSGKFYLPFANSNVSETEALADEHFLEILESEAEAHGCYFFNGEGDPCDLFIGQSRDKPDGDDDGDGDKSTDVAPDATDDDDSEDNGRATYRNGDPITLVHTGCDGCCPNRINGILCHETGCPNEWRDVPVDCQECGNPFFAGGPRQTLCQGCFDDLYGLTETPIDDSDNEPETEQPVTLNVPALPITTSRFLAHDRIRIHAGSRYLYGTVVATGLDYRDASGTVRQGEGYLIELDDDSRKGTDGAPDYDAYIVIPSWVNSLQRVA